MAQTESIAEPAPLTRTVTSPVVVHAASGLQAVFETCPICGDLFQRLFSPAFGSIGECVCVAREKAGREQARELLKGRSDAVERRKAQKMAHSEDERQKRISARLRPIVEGEQLRIEEEERWLDDRKYLAEAEAEELELILKEQAKEN